MRRFVLMLNVLMLSFTAFVCVTDGVSTDPVYLAFTLLLLAVPAFSAWVLRREPDDLAPRLVRQVASALNVMVLLFVGLALMVQQPHPSEPGYLPYVVIICLTPVLSVWALMRPVDRRTLRDTLLHGR